MPKQIADDWDHEITVINGEPIEKFKNSKQYHHNGKFPSMYLGLLGFGKTTLANLTTYVVKGRHDNQDTVVMSDFVRSTTFNPFDYARTYDLDKFNRGLWDYSETIASFSEQQPGAIVDLDARFDANTGKPHVVAIHDIYDPRTGAKMADGEANFDPKTGLSIEQMKNDPYSEASLVLYASKVAKKTKSMKLSASQIQIEREVSSTGMFGSDSGGDY